MARFTLIFAFTFVLGFGPAVAQVVAAPGGPVVVTVAGKVGVANRGGLNSFQDGFFKFHKKKFTRAYSFDRTMLAALPQIQVSARAVNWPARVAFKGPLLADVLARAQAVGSLVTIYALDGYGVKFTPEELREKRWVLALSADGKPLGIGGRGPAWLVHETPEGAPAREDEEAKWVWSVFYIEAE